MDAYCAKFILKGKAPDGSKLIFHGYSEHVWIAEKQGQEGRKTDMLHFAADSMALSIGEICQAVTDLGGSFDYDCGWLDAYVPMSCVRLLTFGHDEE